jgi:hypothetical protein
MFMQRMKELALAITKGAECGALTMVNMLTLENADGKKLNESTRRIAEYKKKNEIAGLDLLEWAFLTGRFVHSDVLVDPRGMLYLFYLSLGRLSE